MKSKDNDNSAISQQLNMNGRHHARYVEPDVPVHVIAKTFQGRLLLVPSKFLNQIIVGVVARGLELYPEVKLHALVVLSNHMHAMISADTPSLALFMRYIKGEISYRWSRHIGWSQNMWTARYVATALPTSQSQENCLKYILSQGVKEGFVAKAHQWPGVHCAKNLASARPLKGRWFNATDWRRKVNAQARCNNPKPIKKSDFWTDYTLDFVPIPAWRDFDQKQQHQRVKEMLVSIEQEGRSSRKGKPPMGVKQIQRQSRLKTKTPPKLPWYQERRRMICWAAAKAKETVEYMERYWRFQRAFRIASDAFRKGELTVNFPPGAFRPISYCVHAALG